MRPATCELYLVIVSSFGLRLDHACIGSISIDLQDAVKAGKMPRHALCAPAVFEAVSHHWRTAPTIRAIIARISPKPGLGGLARSWSQSGQTRFVSEDPFTFFDPLKDKISAYLKLEAQMPHPLRHQTPADRNTIAQINCFLTIKRKAIGIFGNGDIGE